MMERESNMTELIEIVEKARTAGASDIHFVSGTQMMFRIDGVLRPMSEENMEASQIAGFVETLLDVEAMQELERVGELEYAYSMTDTVRLRINIYCERGTYAMALRLLPMEIPTPERLGIPDAVVRLTEKKRGLVIVTGTTGSGKTTTLASLIDQIAQNEVRTIITLEEPIEYVHKHNKSVVVQREIGHDSMSYKAALRAAVRQDADVICVGEIRDAETLAMALEAAGTGHLVFLVMHANNVVSAVEQMVERFLPHQQQQIRMQLSEVLQGVVAQQLLPKQDVSGRVAAFEVLLSEPNVSNLIKENKLHQMQTLIQAKGKQGMQTMDDAIYNLYLMSAISSDTAIRYAQDPTGMKEKVKLF